MVYYISVHTLTEIDGISATIVPSMIAIESIAIAFWDSGSLVAANIASVLVMLTKFSLFT